MKTKIDQYLNSLPVSKKTIRNYRSDANHFFLWVALRESGGLETKYSNELFSEYLTFLYQSKTPERTIKRRLTSLKHVARSLIKENILTKSFRFHPQRLSIRITTHPYLGKTISITALATSFAIIALSLASINETAQDTKPFLLPSNSIRLYQYPQTNSTNEFSWVPNTIHPQNKDGVEIVLKPSDFPTIPTYNNANVLGSEALTPCNGLKQIYEYK